jgi:hypothetical protein
MTCILFFTACDLKKEKVSQLNSEHVNTKEKKEKKKINALQSTINKLEGNIAEEENYLFFNEADGSKKITLTFKSDYNEQPITHVTLYQDGKMVSDKVRIIDSSIHDRGQFTIGLKEYLPFFNEIKLITNQQQILTLKTGQYNFEKVNIKNLMPDNERWSILNYNTGENGASFTFNASYNRDKVVPSDYKLYLTKLSIEKLKVKETHNEKVNGKNLELTVQCDALRKFQHQASYEMMVIQKNKENEQYLMSTLFIVIDPS